MASKKALEEIRERSINAGADPELVNASLHVMQGITNALVGMSFLNISDEDRAQIAKFMEVEPAVDSAMDSTMAEDSPGSDERLGRMVRNRPNSTTWSSRGQSPGQGNVREAAHRSRRSSGGSQDPERRRSDSPTRDSSTTRPRRSHSSHRHRRHTSDHRHDRCSSKNKRRRSRGHSNNRN